jgi:hypothetical protein
MLFSDLPDVNTHLNMMARVTDEAEEKIYYDVAAKKARQQITEKLADSLPEEDADANHVNKWEYATIANCCFGLGDNDNAGRYENIFFSLVEADWERETYLTSKEHLLDL